jgi:hypothetical protein
MVPMTAQGPPAARANAAGDIAFRLLHNVGTLKDLISRLTSPACTCPCQRFATVETHQRIQTRETCAEKTCQR